MVVALVVSIGWVVSELTSVSSHFLGSIASPQLRSGVSMASESTMQPTVLVVDFGAQYAQLIARRVREAQVYSEIVPHKITAQEVLKRKPIAIILSGGPASVRRYGWLLQTCCYCPPNAKRRCWVNSGLPETPRSRECSES